jgi:hypothetical protein
VMRFTCKGEVFVNFLKKLTLKKKKLEFITSLYALLWGIWLLLPWDTFGSSSIFHMMGRIMPELAWGLLFTVFGLSALIFSFTDKSRIRAMFSGILMFIFISISILAAVSNLFSTAIPSFLVMAIAEWITYGEILADIKEKI